MKTEYVLEFSGKQCLLNELETLIKNEFRERGYKLKEIIKLHLYIQPEKDIVYYVAELKSERTIKGEIKL